MGSAPLLDADIVETGPFLCPGNRGIPRKIVVDLFTSVVTGAREGQFPSVRHTNAAAAQGMGGGRIRAAVEPDGGRAGPQPAATLGKAGASRRASSYLRTTSSATSGASPRAADTAAPSAAAWSATRSAKKPGASR